MACSCGLSPPSSLSSSHYNRRSPRLFIITLIKGQNGRKMALGQYKRDMTEDPDYASPFHSHLSYSILHTRPLSEYRAVFNPEAFIPFLLCDLESYCPAPFAVAYILYTTAGVLS